MNDLELRIYDVTDSINVNLVYQENIFYHGFKDNLAVFNNKLYVSARFNIAIYDLINNFEKFIYGRSNEDFRIKDEYLIENPRYSNDINIYSVLDEDSTTYTISDISHETESHKVHDMIMIDNKIFLVSSQVDNFDYFNFNFYLYEIDENTPHLILKEPMPINFWPEHIKVFGEYVILSTPTLPSINNIYKYYNNNIQFLGQFLGNMSYSTGFESNNYFLNFYNSSVEYRDLNDPSLILYTIDITSTEIYSNMKHINENLITLSSFPSNIYKLNYQLSDFTLTYSIESYYSLYNGFLTTVSNNNIIISDIDKGVPRIINNWVSDFLSDRVYIFPKKNSMIFISGSSINVYDIEYTVSDSDIEIPQMRTELLSNYPNPFNPETTIVFYVGNALVRSDVSIGTINGTNVTLDIYNIRGQRIKRLVDDFMETGEHRVGWDGKDDSGREMSSGVYLYRMVAGEQEAVRRMLLLK